MGDLISRAKAIAMHRAECSGDCGCCKYYIAQNLECGVLLNVPAVDAVEVVRCKDCEFATDIGTDYLICGGWGFRTDHNGFCYRGAKKDGDADG